MTTYWSFLNDLEPALVSMAWRGGAWMLLVALVLGCSTKASAATRHWIAVCGMAGLLLVTALGMADMRWIISTPASAVLREPVVVASPASMAGSHAGEAAPVVHLQSATVPAEASSAALSFTVTEAKEISSPRPSEPIPWLALTWSAGVAFFGLRLLRTALLLHRLRCASVAASEAVVAEVEKLRQQLGVRVPVTLLTADGPVMPIAWGVFRPTILLPPDAGEWPHLRIRAVLLHELSHLRRR